MALDARLPLGVQGVDTTQVVPAMQDAQNNALAQIKQKYANANAEEQLDVLSTGLGAAQALQLAEADPAAAVQFLESRNQKILARNGDNENTQMLLDTIKKSPEQFKQLAGAYVNTAKLAGAFELGTDSQGGATGVLLNRLVAAGQQENPNYGLLDALEDLKGGAGQRGKNLADIESGREANYETQSGQNESNLEFNPIIEARKAEVEKLQENIDGFGKAQIAYNSVKENLAGFKSGERLSRDVGAVVGARNPLRGGLPGGINVPGSAAAGGQAKVDQLKGKVFLEAYETLKGGGQITEVEGAKAEAAKVRLGQAQNEKDFLEALDDFEFEVDQLYELTKLKASQAEKRLSKYGIDQSPVFVNPLNPGMTLPGAGTSPAADYSNMSDEELLRALQ